MREAEPLDTTGNGDELTRQKKVQKSICRREFKATQTVQLISMNPITSVMMYLLLSFYCAPAISCTSFRGEEFARTAINCDSQYVKRVYLTITLGATAQDSSDAFLSGHLPNTLHTTYKSCNSHRPPCPVPPTTATTCRLHRFHS